jgi:hypothetical protein
LGEAFLIGLASYRLWRLVAVDAITERPRDWLLVRSPQWVDKMTMCPWCLGSWVAFGVTWATDAAVGVASPLLVALAAAVVVGWLAQWLV